MTTAELLRETSLTVSTLDYWKWTWKKSGKDCWDMGLRIIGKKAYWDPISFLNWLYINKVKNKPKDGRDKNIVLFVQRNSSEKDN